MAVFRRFGRSTAIARLAALTVACAVHAQPIPRRAEQSLSLAVEGQAPAASLAWLPQRADSLMPLLHLNLNLPAYRLDVYVRNERVRSYLVAIGMPAYRTPRGDFEISQVEWNPWWIPPKSEWAKNDHVTPPGSTNPMGKARFPFRPPYFIHGTPDETSLGKSSSHGCVRLANRDAVDLAKLIQGSLVGSAVSDSIAGLVLRTLRTKVVKPPERVPLVVRYDLVEIVAETLFVYPDPYRLGTSPSASAKKGLSQAGLDTAAVDYARLRRLTRYPERTAVSMLIHRRVTGQLPRSEGRGSLTIASPLSRIPEGS